jgi:hypothetical protein
MTLLQQTIIHERKMIKMLGDNLKKLRQSRGLSQEEMAGKLNVVRQTVSKWEKGLSVPDSEMLMEIARQFEIPVSTLLGETPGLEDEASDMRIVLEKLTLINEQLARSAQAKRRALRAVCISVIAVAGMYLVLDLLINCLPVFVNNVEASSIGIIGGADGPTAIFVSEIFGHPLAFIVLAAALIAAVAGLVYTRKK